MSFVEADAWLRAVIDAVPQPLWVIDPDGKVAQTNETAARVLGYRDHRRLVGVPSHETLHRRREDGSHYPAVECPIVNAPLNSGKQRGREVFLTLSGHPLHVTWSISALPLPRYRMLAFLPNPIARPAELAAAPSLPTASALRDQIALGFRDPDLTPHRLAQANHVSLRTLQAILAREHDSPAALIRARRLAHARRLLDEGTPAGIAAFESGFRDTNTFARAFRRSFGVAPSAYAGRY